MDTFHLHAIIFDMGQNISIEFAEYVVNPLDIFQKAFRTVTAMVTQNELCSRLGTFDSNFEQAGGLR